MGRAEIWERREGRGESRVAAPARCAITVVPSKYRAPPQDEPGEPASGTGSFVTCARTTAGHRRDSSRARDQKPWPEGGNGSLSPGTYSRSTPVLSIVQSRMMPPDEPSRDMACATAAWVEARAGSLSDEGADACASGTRGGRGGARGAHRSAQTSGSPLWTCPPCTTRRRGRRCTSSPSRRSRTGPRGTCRRAARCRPSRRGWGPSPR